MKNTLGFLGLKNVLKKQLILMIILISLFSFLYGQEGLKSSVLGSLGYIIPQTYFGWLIFRTIRLDAVKKVFSAEAKKIMMAGIIFYITFSCCTVLPVVYFSSFIAMNGVIFLSGMCFKTNK